MLRIRPLTRLAGGAPTARRLFSSAPASRVLPRSAASRAAPLARSFHASRTISAAPTSSTSSADSAQQPQQEQQQQQQNASDQQPPPSTGRSWQTMLGITLFLGTACFTVYLGVWQVKRRAWKTALISRREKALEAEPMELQEYLKTRPNVAVVDRSASIDAASEVLEAANDLRRVTTRGRLLYDKTLLLGPRNPPSTDNSSTAGQGSGFYLVTPLRLHDGRLILVNRGWCSLENLASASRETRDLSEVVEVVGVVRKGEQQPQFLEEYDPVQTGSWIWLDLPRMARVAGILDGKDGGATHASNFPSSSQAEPILVDALEIAGNRNKNMKRRSLGEYVIFTTTPMIHTVYATTWFTLSAALVALTYVRFKKKMPMPNRATQAALSNRK